MFAKHVAWRLRAAWILVAFTVASHALAADDKPPAWKDCLKQKPAWYAGAVAARIADNVLLHQRACGGWPKNLDFAAELSDKQRQAVTADRDRNDATLDNGATTTQVSFLARVHRAAPQSETLAAYERGLDYILAAQYENGGWPQNYPKPSGYHAHITFNDDAMVRVLTLLSEVAAGAGDHAFADPTRRRRAAQAVARGIDCVLKCQIVVDGRRTVWCAQHDARTLAPAAARSYEKASFSGGESAGLARFLMTIERPSPEVIAAVDGAAAWFEAAKLTGIRVDEVRAADGKKDKVVVADPRAPPLWARFYDLKTTRPIFCGRDGVVKERLADIEQERRAGYAWYTNAPAQFLDRDYPAWKKRLGR